MEYGYMFLGSLTLIYLAALLYWVFLKDLINVSSNVHFKRFYTRVFSYSDLSLVGTNKNSIFRSVNVVTVTAASFTFLLTLACAYWLFSPDLVNEINDQRLGISDASNNVCNVFDGKWVKDESYPLYNATDCPFAEKGFNCFGNGRKDREYMKWRWKPSKCEIPIFDVQALLRYLRGKRVVFVGDSLTRTQWESFICMLMSGVDDKRFVYEVNQNKITKQTRFLNVRFDSYNFTVEFYRSVFLVLATPAPKKAPKRVKWTLRLDKMDSVNEEWVDADVLVFNTGHWWTKTKLFETGTYFQVGGTLKLGMPVTKALTKGLETWSSWVKSRIDPNRTHVFFRTFEVVGGLPVLPDFAVIAAVVVFVAVRLLFYRIGVNTGKSFSSGDRSKCKVSRRPMLTTQGRDRSPISDVILKVVKKMSVPVTALHVTPMGAYRSDAHVGAWSDNPSVPDCSHWCLPGVPDMWNEILVTSLLHKDQISRQTTAN